MFWEAPVAGAEAFFGTLLETLVIDSVTDVLAGV